MKNFFILAFLYVTLNQITFAAYNIASLPDSMKKNTNAVLWDYSIDIIINKDFSYTERVHKIITILKEKGNNNALYEGYESKDVSSKLLQGIIYDENGMVFKKIKKSDLNTIGEYSQFISDFKEEYYNPEVHKFPYTVEYEYETKYDYLLSLPEFSPFLDYNTSIINASYSIETPNDLDIRSYQQNNTWKPTVINTDSRKKYTYKINNQTAISEEKMSPTFDKIEPKIIFAPDRISYHGYKNKFEDWTDFGNWILQLNNNRDSLPADVKEKMHLIKSSYPDVLARAKVIYKWMQDNTRYYSIQLGLGGYRPMKTLDVNKNKYGDCKALSFYVQTLFREAGIDAYYTLVKAGKNNGIIKQMPANQFNHAIICMPLKNDTIWLECTDQKIPFGYLGDFTDDRDVLVINNHPSIVHTKTYSVTDNIKSIQAQVNIQSDFQTTGTLHYLTQGLQYEKLYKLEYLPSKELRDKRLYELLNVNNIQLDEYSFLKDDSIIPKETFTTIFRLSNFIATVGSKIIFTPNIFSKYNTSFQYDSTRILPIEQDENISEVDSIQFFIPDNLAYKNDAEPQQIATKFGNYFTQIIYDNKNNTLLYIRKFSLNKGSFPASDQITYYDFIKKVTALDNARIILAR